MKLKFSITEAAEKIIQLEASDIKKSVKAHCRSFRLRTSNIVVNADDDGEVYIVTPYGTLQTDTMLCHVKLYKGLSTGSSAGTNDSGHILPASDTARGH